MSAANSKQERAERCEAMLQTDLLFVFQYFLCLPSGDIDTIMGEIERSNEI